MRRQLRRIKVYRRGLGIEKEERGKKMSGQGARREKFREEA